MPRKIHLQITRTKIIRDRVTSWMHSLDQVNSYYGEQMRLKEMYLKRLEWHRRIVEHEEQKKTKILEKKQFQKKAEFMNKSLKEKKDQKTQKREAEFAKKKEMYEFGKKEFLLALSDEESEWEYHPDELKDRRYHIVRAHGPYYTKFN